jgi:TatD DNase family protein
MLIDTHCHLDVAEFDLDRPQVLEAARARGVRRIVLPAIHAAGWPGLLSLCDREPGLYPALGLHPIYLDRHQPRHLTELSRLIDQDPPVAVGEIGLDFFVADLDRHRQQALFEAQLALAAASGLPVLIHARKAHDQILAFLRRIRIRGGIAHAFNGSLQQAHHYLDLGFKLGFGGMLTFERSHRLRALARALPLGALVLETDAPDLTVEAHRGERNSPAYLPDVLMALAEIRGENPQFLAEETSRNALEVLDLDAWEYRHRRSGRRRGLEDPPEWVGDK